MIDVVCCREAVRLGLPKQTPFQDVLMRQPVDE